MQRCAADRMATQRFVRPDVIHGILDTGTNVNTMVIPSSVGQVDTIFTKPATI